MSTKVDELKLDVEELNQLLSGATRQRVQGVISLEIRKLQTEISRLQELSGSGEVSKTTPASQPKTNRCYEVKLNNYAWDQSPKFVKIFVTVKNVQTLPAENVYTTLTDNSMELHINGLENRNYTLSIKNLLEKIDCSGSSWKVKNDMVVVSLAKATAGNDWSHLTTLEKKAKDPKPTPKPAENSDDPSSGLMDLMRQMYEDGDDDMKRNIAKAWTESRNNSGMPSF